MMLCQIHTSRKCNGVVGDDIQSKVEKKKSKLTRRKKVSWWEKKSKLVRKEKFAQGPYTLIIF